MASLLTAPMTLESQRLVDVSSLGVHHNLEDIAECTDGLANCNDEATAIGSGHDRTVKVSGIVSH